MFNVNGIGQIAHEQEENVRLQIWTGIAIFLFGIGIMWLININELRFFNILIAIAAMMAIALVGSKTKTLVGFSLAGVIVHLLQGKSLPDGVSTGLGWLLNLLVAVTFVFALSAFVLTSLSYATARGSFWVLALGSLTGVLTHLFFKDSGSGIKKKIMVFVFIVIAVASFQPVKATIYEYFGLTAKEKEVEQKKVRQPTYSSQPISQLEHTAIGTKAFGTFKPFQLESGQILGPVNQYEGSCLFVTKSGAGNLAVYSRPDFTSQPVKAIMADNQVGVRSWGHAGPAYQVFYESEKGSVTLELERRRGNHACS